MKKMLSMIFIVVCFLMCTCNLSYAEETTYYGENTLSAFNITHIVIPEGIAEILNNACNGNQTVEEVTIPNSIKKIEENAFSNCPNLKTIYMPKDFLKLYVGTNAWAKLNINPDAKLKEKAEGPKINVKRNGDIVRVEVSAERDLGEVFIGLANKDGGYLGNLIKTEVKEKVLTSDQLCNRENIIIDPKTTTEIGSVKFEFQVDLKKFKKKVNFSGEKVYFKVYVEDWLTTQAIYESDDIYSLEETNFNNEVDINSDGKVNNGIIEINIKSTTKLTEVFVGLVDSDGKSISGRTGVDIGNFIEENPKISGIEAIKESEKSMKVKIEAAEFFDGYDSRRIKVYVEVENQEPTTKVFDYTYIPASESKITIKAEIISTEGKYKDLKEGRKVGEGVKFTITSDKSPIKEVYMAYTDSKGYHDGSYLGNFLDTKSSKAPYITKSSDGKEVTFEITNVSEVFSLEQDGYRRMKIYAQAEDNSDREEYFEIKENTKYEYSITSTIPEGMVDNLSDNAIITVSSSYYPITSIKINNVVVAGFIEETDKEYEISIKPSDYANNEVIIEATFADGGIYTRKFSWKKKETNTNNTGKYGETKDNITCIVTKHDKNENQLIISLNLTEKNRYIKNVEINGKTRGLTGLENGTKISLTYNLAGGKDIAIKVDSKSSANNSEPEKSTVFNLAWVDESTSDLGQTVGQTNKDEDKFSIMQSAYSNGKVYKDDQFIIELDGRTVAKVNAKDSETATTVVLKNQNKKYYTEISNFTPSNNVYKFDLVVDLGDGDSYVKKYELYNRESVITENTITIAADISKVKSENKLNLILTVSGNRHGINSNLSVMGVYIRDIKDGKTEIISWGASDNKLDSATVNKESNMETVTMPIDIGKYKDGEDVVSFYINYNLSDGSSYEHLVNLDLTGTGNVLTDGKGAGTSTTPPTTTTPTPTTTTPPTTTTDEFDWSKVLVKVDSYSAKIGESIGTESDRKELKSLGSSYTFTVENAHSDATCKLIYDNKVGAKIEENMTKQADGTFTYKTVLNKIKDNKVTVKVSYKDTEKQTEIYFKEKEETVDTDPSKPVSKYEAEWKEIKLTIGSGLVENVGTLKTVTIGEHIGSESNRIKINHPTQSFWMKLDGASLYDLEANPEMTISWWNNNKNKEEKYEFAYAKNANGNSADVWSCVGYSVKDKKVTVKVTYKDESRTSVIYFE